MVRNDECPSLRRVKPSRYLVQASPFAEEQVLAGAHTRTEADVWSIEGAIESGRRAAHGINPRVTVLSQYRPRLLRWVGLIDDLLYSVRAPHVLDLTLLALLAALVALLAALWF